MWVALDLYRKCMSSPKIHVVILKRYAMWSTDFTGKVLLTYKDILIYFYYYYLKNKLETHLIKTKKHSWSLIYDCNDLCSCYVMNKALSLHESAMSLHYQNLFYVFIIFVFNIHLDSSTKWTPDWKSRLSRPRLRDAWWHWAEKQTVNIDRYKCTSDTEGQWPLWSLHGSMPISLDHFDSIIFYLFFSCWKSVYTTKSKLLTVLK